MHKPPDNLDSMPRSGFKDKKVQAVGLKDLLKEKYPTPLTDLESYSAQNNLLGFFETLLEIAKGNSELIVDSPHLNHITTDTKH